MDVVEFYCTNRLLLQSVLNNSRDKLSGMDINLSINQSINQKTRTLFLPLLPLPSPLFRIPLHTRLIPHHQPPYSRHPPPTKPHPSGPVPAEGAMTRVDGSRARTYWGCGEIMRRREGISYFARLLGRRHRREDEDGLLYCYVLQT